MEAAAAISSAMAWEYVRIMIPSAYRDRTRAVSRTGSPRPICVSAGERNRACPPSRVIPTSNDTRVLVDAFWNTIASDLPARGRGALPFLHLRFQARPDETRAEERRGGKEGRSRGSPY